MTVNTITGILTVSAGTATTWKATTKVIQSGVLCYETDTGRAKISDGVHLYTALPYFVGGPDFKQTNIVAAGAAGTINFDASNESAVFYTQAATGNFNLNFRGDLSTTLDSIMAVGQSLALTVLSLNGSTAYFATAVTVDGVAVTPKWKGGVAPTAGNASAIDKYTYTLIKTAAGTFTILADQEKFA